MKRIIGPLLVLLLAAGVAAETVRGTSTSLVALEPRTDLQPSLSLKPDQLAAIALPADARFFRAIVAEVVISEALRRYADSFAVAVYSDVSPAPTGSERVYTGRRVMFRALPFGTRVFVRIPIVAREGMDKGPEPVLEADAVAAGRFPLLLVVQPVMKGIPDSVLDRPFFVTLRAEIQSRGLVDLRISRPAGFQQEAVQVLLDSRPVDPGKAPLEVEAGVHQLEVVSEVFQKETASFAVSPGQTTSLEIALSPVASYLTVDAVAGAVVYLDGEKLDLPAGQRRQLTEGIHTIRFKIGETNVSKRVEVRKGRSYHVSLGLELVIKEE